jgi:hypothetical protein
MSTGSTGRVSCLAGVELGGTGFPCDLKLGHEGPHVYDQPASGKEVDMAGKSLFYKTHVRVTWLNSKQAAQQPKGASA